MRTRSLYGRAYLGGLIRNRVNVALADGLISEVRIGDPAPGAELIEGVILPGFIDVHVHGAAGADFMDADRRGTSLIIDHHARNGTTAMAATTLSASPEDLSAAVEAIAGAVRESGPGTAEIVAIHLEGPFINPARAGAQDPSSIRPPDIPEIEALIRKAPDVRWLLTMAPELEGSTALIERFRDDVILSVGHSDATFGEALEAFERGASHVTHLFNAMRPLHHREPGVIGALLTTDDVTAELIADGVHLHPAVLSYFARSLPSRIVLVTDAMRACGMPHGNYRLYEHEVTVDENGARLADGKLAGSTLTMGRAVCNMVELAGLPLELIVPMVSETPARILGVSDRKGKIEVGFDADLVVISPQLTTDRVFARGVEVAAA